MNENITAMKLCDIILYVFSVLIIQSQYQKTQANYLERSYMTQKSELGNEFWWVH